MSKWLRTSLAMMIAAIVVVIIWRNFERQRPELLYAGKPESYWLNSLANGTWPTAGWEKLGTNRVLLLAKALNWREGIRQRTWLVVWPRLPDWLQVHFSKPIDTPLVARLMAATQLIRMGKDAQPAIPALIHVLKTDRDVMMRSIAAGCLGEMKSAVPEVVAALTGALNDSSPDVRDSAANALKILNRQTEKIDQK